eukprot:4856712-Pleurochrysis_carterae.AAC.1
MRATASFENSPSVAIPSSLPPAERPALLPLPPTPPPAPPIFVSAAQRQTLPRARNTATRHAAADSSDAIGDADASACKPASPWSICRLSACRHSDACAAHDSSTRTAAARTAAPASQPYVTAGATQAAAARTASPRSSAARCAGMSCRHPCPTSLPRDQSEAAATSGCVRASTASGVDGAL